MAEVESPIQVGFAEFIARLMSEVFDSVITSQVDQEERYAQMVVSASLSPEAYGSQFIDDEDVAAAAPVFFPARAVDKDQPSAVYPGSPYARGKGGAEDPPFTSLLGIELAKADLVSEGDGQVLTEAGVGTVLAGIRLRLARDHLAVAGQIVARGLPRVVVDSGRINGKLTFHLTEKTEGGEVSGEPPPFSSAAALAKGSGIFSRASLITSGTKNVFTLPKARILPNVKLMVKQADDTSPQSTQVTANVYGEVEITFKTVT